MSTARHHIATMLVPAWGHTVSYIHLARLMLNADPDLVITLVQHNILLAQMEGELSTCEYDPARLRIIGLGDKDLPFSPDQVKVVFGETVAGWFETIKKLAEGSEGWPKPRTVHMDFFGGGITVDQTKEILGPDTKTVLWFSTALVSMPGHLTDYDFAATVDEIFADEKSRKGRSKEEILETVSLAWNGGEETTGMVVKLPGAPDMYDYERWACGSGAPEGIGMLLCACQKFAKVADGYIVPTASCLEPVGVPYWKQASRERGQEFFPVGMQAHDGCWKDDFESSSASPTNTVVKAFLDDAVSKYGPKSVLYISFGSHRQPPLHPHPFPFIFALGGKLASLPKETIERVNSSGRGLVCDFWVEQRAILQSGAIGWFLTHGGFNSTTESLSQGIPLIMWPTNAEQPVNAALLSQEPNPVAIELLQVRTGRQLGPSLRAGPVITGTVEDATKEFVETFEKTRGERGAFITTNAVKMAKALREARKGEAAQEIKRLAAF
ncbi:hypothetical protein FB45DRAFT_844579 [Roridomyces roridus]|uniref:Glycosyltransferase n=1 Tax=Roridomyces roridus TaxID=1738132 RepID=A0AAD7FBP7_9AGAR|nr:hypothetical protein FB45DRAFT_844579 [Roridomyces roridus]